MFAIDVERSRALEWSEGLATWSVLDAAGHIADPVFAVPLPIAMLVHSARTDDAVARALIAKRNAVIEAIRAEDRAEGRAQAIVDILSARGVAASPAERDRILGERDAA